jgi:hypothetical protein
MASKGSSSFDAWTPHVMALAHDRKEEENDIRARGTDTLRRAT